MALPDQLLQPLGWLALAMAALGLILALGRRIGTALQLRLWGIHEPLRLATRQNPPQGRNAK